MQFKYKFLLVLFLCLSRGVEGDQIHHPYVSEKVWRMVTPYLMPEDHPLKKKLDELFSKKRYLKNGRKLLQAGFLNKRREPYTKVIVTRHKDMPGYIFKIYTDDRPGFKDDPEYLTWIYRARGARLARREIKERGWEAYFKAPKKWIYALPPYPEAKEGALQKNFILVEEEMDILSMREIMPKWRNGTITKEHLNMLFTIITRIGLKGGCKVDNIPICKDGRIAFIDTQSNLRHHLPYERLFQVLEGDLKEHWQHLINNWQSIPRLDPSKESII